MSIVLLTLATLVAQQPSNIAASAPTASPSTALVCRVVRGTSSRIPRRICLTQVELNLRAEAARRRLPVYPIR